MVRRTRLDDMPKREEGDPLPTTFDSIKVFINVVTPKGTGGGWCHPKKMDDLDTVAERVLDIINDMPAEGRVILVQVHLERQGITVWAQGGPKESYVTVLEKARRIWHAAKQAWQREHIAK